MQKNEDNRKQLIEIILRKEREHERNNGSPTIIMRQLMINKNTTQHII